MGCQYHGHIVDGATCDCAILFDIYSCSRRKLLRAWVRTIVVETTRETAIVLDGLGEVGNWQSSLIQSESGRAVITFGKWVVEDDCV